MNCREAVLRAFHFEEVRPVPYTIWYDQQTERKLDTYYRNSNWKSRIHNYIFRVSLDWQPRRYIDSERFIDINGSLWRDENHRHLEQPVLNEASLRGFELPSYKNAAKEQQQQTWESSSFQGRGHLPLDAAVQALQNNKIRAFTVVDYGHGLFETAWMIQGYEELLADYVLSPDFVHELLDSIVERQLELLDVVASNPCDAIMIVDDYADQRGVMLGADRWRLFIKERLAKLYRRIHETGEMTFHHSCGNVFEIIPDLSDIGLDVLQSVQPEAMPVYELKKKCGSRLRLWGGFGNQRLLPFGTPSEIRGEVRKLKRELGRRGGCVVTSSKPIMGEVPAENAAAFIEEMIANE